MKPTQEELLLMHRYCLKFRGLVWGGGTPSAMHCINFRAYSNLTYQYGVAYEVED